MGVVVALAAAAAVILLFGSQITKALGIVAACATFSFPIGLIGMVGIGVSLLFLLSPRDGTD